MKLQQSLWIHGIVLAAASGLAWKTWTSDESQVTLTRERVQVWSGKLDQLTAIAFESPKAKVELKAHKDEAGRWFEVQVDKEVPGKVPAHHHGAGGAGPETPTSTRETKTFVSVTEANKLAESLAPLMALRAIGRVEGEREKEFGLDEPGGTVAVRFAGASQTLLIGGVTPGGGDRYARVKETGEVFAVPGDVVRRLEQAESRLFENQLQVFDEEGPNRVKILYGDQARELVSVEGKVDGWANASTPSEQDETASNWMGKLGKLRAKTYLSEAKALEGQQPAFQVEYLRGTRLVGRFQLYKVPEAGNADPGASAESPSGHKYLARTQHTRWPVELSGNPADIEQDLASLFE